MDFNRTWFRADVPWIEGELRRCGLTGTGGTEGVWTEFRIHILIGKRLASIADSNVPINWCSKRWQRTTIVWSEIPCLIIFYSPHIPESLHNSMASKHTNTRQRRSNTFIFFILDRDQDVWSLSWRSKTTHRRPEQGKEHFLILGQRNFCGGEKKQWTI